jgi:phenylalanyl-tRNA synthetase beta chain
MNILIPDSWLRDHLETKATPKEIKDLLSLSGPSVERINYVEGEPVYDIEITTNRVDAFSVRGVAREASVILPEFGIPAALKPYDAENKKGTYPKEKLDITFKNDASLCYRILAIRVSDIHLTESPDWMKKRLELVGQRPLNNIVDITNYVMWEVGHPFHVFDYDRLLGKQIIVRLGKKGEKLTTLNDKTHVLRGGEIVFDDGTGTIIDLPGIMGTANTVVTNKTKNVLLFIENSDQVRIRRASMGLAIRSQAAVINEKHPDPELALVAMKRAIDLTVDLTHGKLTSELVDIYPVKPKPKPITVSKALIDQYLGTSIDNKRVGTILTRLGCTVTVDENSDKTTFTVTPPTSRNDDMTIGEDVVEEVARIIGYHTITPRLPDREPPPVTPDPKLIWEEKIKNHLANWGYTEIYGYSMISEELVSLFALDTKDLYTIANPLTTDHVFLRPTLVPTMISIVGQNMGVKDSLFLFELSHTYNKVSLDLPQEKSELVVAVTGQAFLKLKGLAMALFVLFGIPFPDTGKYSEETYYQKNMCLSLGTYGSLGVVADDLLHKMGIKSTITILRLSFDELVKDAKPEKSYTPIPKYPPIIEDISFVFPAEQFVGPVISYIRSLHPLISSVQLLDTYENRRTVRISYQDKEKTLTSVDSKPIREKIIEKVKEKFGCTILQ